jgi:hypothetical protein
MVDAPSERWAKFDIVTKAVSGALLPLIIVLVGHWYTTEQQKANSARLQQDKDAEADQRKVDRVAAILKHLASESVRERLLGIAFVSYLNDHKEAPPELGPGLIAIVSTETDERVIAAASSSSVIAQAVQSDPQLAKNVGQAAESNPIAAQALARNRKLDETLTTISDSGTPLEKEAAKVAVKSIFKGTSFTGYDKEVIKVEITAEGTLPMVVSALNGSNLSTQPSFSFALDKAKNNPSILQIYFDFSGESGVYRVAITGSKGEPLNYTVKGPPTQIVTFRFFMT